MSSELSAAEIRVLAERAQAVDLSPSDQVREWFTTRGWEPSAFSAYDEGVEAWRWTHPTALEEFTELGVWDEPPAVSLEMRQFMYLSEHESTQHLHHREPPIDSRIRSV